MSDLKNIWPNIHTTNIEKTKVTLTMAVPENIDYFAGHFPGTPILAGVVQLHWAVEYAKQYFALNTLDVNNIEVLKFQNVIMPCETLTLTLQQKSPHKVLFSYASPNGSHASGRILFEELQ